MARSDIKRRWFGGIVLGTAALMLVAGETVLKGRMSSLAFIIYWLVCFILTGTAIFVALIDARVLQYRTRREHRELVQDTMDAIESDAKTRHKRRRD